MIKTIIRNEWRQWRRDRRLKALAFFLLLLSAVALAHQLRFQNGLRQTRAQAQQESRREWLSQELKHPHIAAHFGNYAYKKPSPLHSFDPGLTLYTGSSVYLEPHRQNDFLFSKSGESDTGLRFGWLSPALVCQMLLPLLIILLTFNSVNGERESGTLSLLLIQGASYRQVLLAKVLAVFLAFEVFLSLYLSLSVLGSSWLFGVMPDGLPLLYLWVVYSAYLLAWCLAGVLVSSWRRGAGSSISLLLALWMTTCILVPRVSANLAENAYPLITNQEFRKQVAAAIEKGLDGHDTQSERAHRMEQELLERYGVDSVQQLPFNFEGYLMQQGEEYSSQVYDRYFAGIFQSLQNQERFQSATGLISPFLSLRNLSMAACQGSLESEIDFQRQAEQYRRAFVQRLNNDMRDHSAYGSFDSYKVSQGVYASMQDVEIASRPLAQRLRGMWKEQLWLLAWLLLLSLLIYKTKNTNR